MLPQHYARTVLPQAPPHLLRPHELANVLVWRACAGGDGEPQPAAAFYRAGFFDGARGAGPGTLGRDFQAPEIREMLSCPRWRALPK